MGYLVHYNVLTDRLEGRKFIESSSLAQQAYQTEVGDMYARHAFIETASLSKEIQITTGGDVRVRSLFEINEPSDLSGLTLWLKSSSGVSHSQVSYPGMNAYEGVTSWTPVAGYGSGSYISQSGTGTIGPFTYYQTVPTFVPSASAAAPGSYPVLWFMGISAGNVYPSLLRNTATQKQSFPMTLMVKFDGNLSTANGGGPVFSPNHSSTTGSTGDGSGYVRPTGFFYPYVGAETDVPQSSGFIAHSVQSFDYAQTWTVNANGIVRCWDALNPLSQFTSSAASMSLDTIGAWYPYPNRWLFATGISEICIWNRVLSDTEIRDMNTSYFYPRYKGVLAVQP